MRGLEPAVRDVLDRRLLPASPRPIAVALSGGGDSLALTLIADAWARDAGRDLAILTVDHRLRAESADWTTQCAAVAARLGRPFHALSWEGDKPLAGLPAAARAARHRLLANAARGLGARVILMGHTADDVAEAHAMRAAGSTTPDPRAWAPSPVWPEGRGVFLLRPMLNQSRADLRAWLSARGETWVDDPANEDQRFARARARAGGTSGVAVDDDASPRELAGLAQHADAGIHLPRKALRAAPLDEVVRVLALACVCAGGGERRPATERLRRLADALHGDAPFVATLAGARIEAGDIDVDIFREAGEFHRRSAPPMALPANLDVVWDGRYAVTARRDGLTMRPVAGVAARLPPQEQALLSQTPASRRGSGPAVIYPDGAVSLALVGRAGDDVEIAPIVRGRFEAAAGLVQREPA